MRFEILGPLRVRDGDADVPVAGRRLRRLLVRLLVAGGRPVSVAELTDAVWTGEEPPPRAANALQALVSRLRRVLGDAAPVRQVANGYRLETPAESVDVVVFEALVRDAHEARAGDPALAADLLGRALDLWRGDPLADADGAEYATAAAARLDELRLDVLGDRFEAELARGNAAEVVADLEALTRQHPLRERFSVLLMRALAAAGRTGEGLAAYERTRSVLAEELGADPSAELRRAHLDLLQGDTDPDAEAPGHRTNLRVSRTRFIGRDDEVKRVGSLLESSRLATIVGPGGAGKTRLATEVAADWVARMPGGVWLAELAPVTDPGDVPATLLSALGNRDKSLIDRRPERFAGDNLDRLADALGDDRTLLVIDNCEHLVDQVAAVVDQVLARCRGVTVLATSREPLGIDGEALTAIASLPLPPEGVTAPDALSYQSVQLFADRAAAVPSGFAVDATTVADVVEIVRRLDGLPLAIELAAARLRVLPLAEVARRLTDRFALLTGGSRTALPRHQTLRAVVQWSWDLLTDEERALVERLAVFAGGATEDSVAAVVPDGPVPGVELRLLLDSLVDKSLVQVDGQDEPRYRMLETIREFGLERLAQRGEVARTRAAHARHFAALADEAVPWLRTADQLPWLRRMEADRDNMLAALRYLCDIGDTDAATDLALALAAYQLPFRNFGDLEGWLGDVLRLPPGSEPGQRVLLEALQALGSVASAGGMSSGAEAQMERLRESSIALDEVDPGGQPLLGLVRPVLAFLTGRTERLHELVAEALESPDPWTRASIRMMVANLAENDGDVAAMREHVDRAVQEFREIGDRWGIATSLAAYAQLRTLEGDIEGAVAAYEEATGYLAVLEVTGDDALLHLRMADLRLRLGDLEGARQEAREVRRASWQEARLFSDIALLALAVEEGDVVEVRRLRTVLEEHAGRYVEGHPFQGHGRALALAVVAGAELYDGSVDASRAHMTQAYSAAIGTRDMPVVASVGVAVAELLAAVDRPADAAEVLGASAALRGAEDATDVRIRRLLAGLRETLGERFDAAYDAGRAMDRETAIARLDPTGV